MHITEKNGRLLVRHSGELILIEGWGLDSLRVRATKGHDFSWKDQGLSEPHAERAVTEITDTEAILRNGRIAARLNLAGGFLEFLRDGKVFLKEYYRAPVGANPHSRPLRIYAREYKALPDASRFAISARFESHKGERIFGMGQYQQPEFDLKGCLLELAQRNSQVSIPFYLSSLGYGFLWNNPAVGRVTFGNNLTEWVAECSAELDYWLTVGDTPRGIVERFTAVTGRAPAFPQQALGLWQCKLRYRTQEEVLSVAREYRRRGLPLDTIVVDFYHWIYDGSWDFDPEFWPDPKAMVEELHAMGVRCLVSVWPTVDVKSPYYSEMLDGGMLVRSVSGDGRAMQDKCFYDATNPDARRFVFEKCQKSYLDIGFDGLWLDVVEPEYMPATFDRFYYSVGPVTETMGLYPYCVNQGFYEGMRAMGRQNIANLSRSAWVGNQKHGVVVWSGDVCSNFETLRVQLCAGLQMGMAGIPWWTTDIGGFMGGDVRDPDFHELLIRWFQFATFSPVLRMHGDRRPHDIPPLSKNKYSGGRAHTGQPNELWSYGDEVYEILRKYTLLREELRPYVAELMQEASESGSPLMRAMFYEFPEDERCWSLDDQYMFGGRYLVAPVMELGARERRVYLPQGCWKNLHTGATFAGKTTVLVDAPLDVIPVFERVE